MKADSALAHDIYDVLTEKVYKVFYSRITLKAKLEQDYEPYIFSALNSAKVMLSVGTKYEYFNAVWVKNEWSRYLALMSKDSGKLRIPCYRDIDAYDMPKEFRHLQAQDLGSPRAFQDLMNNIEKIIPLQTAQPEKVVVQQVSSGNPSVDSLLKRVFMFLEDGDWETANAYCEKVLDIDPECARSYLGKLCAELHIHKPDDLADLSQSIDKNTNYQKIMKFGDTELKNDVEKYNRTIQSKEVYDKAVELMNSAKTEQEFQTAEGMFRSISGYKDSDEMADQCPLLYKGVLYDKMVEEYNITKAYNSLNLLADQFRSLGNYKDAEKYVKLCEDKYEEHMEYVRSGREERDRLKAEEKRRSEEEEKRLEAIRRQNLAEAIENRRAYGLCQHCGGMFGVFKKVCSRCGRPKDY